MNPVVPASADSDPAVAVEPGESTAVRERPASVFPDSLAHPLIPEPSLPEPSSPFKPYGTSADAVPAALSRAVRDLRWLLDKLVAEVAEIRTVVVVSADGLLLLSSDPARDQPVAGPPSGSGDLATIVSGLGSLTLGAAELMNAGEVRQTVIAMAEGNLFVMSISDGSLLGVHAEPDCDMSVVAYQMGLFVGQAGHVLTPSVHDELRRSS